MVSAVPTDDSVRLKEIKKTEKYLDLARELKNSMEHEGDGDTYFNWCTWNNPQRILAQSAGAVEYTDCFSAEG